MLVLRKPVKRLTLRVRNNGQIEMVGPHRLSDSEFEQFYRQKRSWAHKVKSRQIQQQSLKPQLTASQFLLHNEIIDTLVPATTGLADNPALAALQKTFRQQLASADIEKKPHAYRSYARVYLPTRLQLLSEQHQLPFGKTSIRSQRTRWGSCSARKNISLNWRLIQMPAEVCDYVLLHELAHTQHMNHSTEFWGLVERMAPEWRVSRDWLRQHGNSLPD